MGCYSVGATAGSRLGELALTASISARLEDPAHRAWVFVVDLRRPKGGPARLRFLEAKDLEGGATELAESAYGEENRFREPSNELGVTLADEREVSGRSVDSSSMLVDAAARLFEFPEVPIFEGFGVPIPVVSPAFSGRLTGDSLGLSGEGLLTGYVESGTVRSAAKAFAASCSDSRAAHCDAAPRASTSEELVDQVERLIGPGDATWSELGVPESCQGECELHGLCVKLSIEPADTVPTD